MVINHLGEANYGHKGRPGQRGGSSKSGETQSRVTGVENPNKGIYTKAKGLFSKDSKPIGDEDTQTIFNAIRVGDIVKGQKSYSDGAPNGSPIKGKVTNMGTEGGQVWLEIEGSQKVERIYSQDYFTKLQYHSKVGSANKESHPGHKGRPGQVGGSTPSNSSVIKVTNYKGETKNWTIKDAALELEGLWQQFSGDIENSIGYKNINKGVYMDVVGDNLSMLFSDSPFRPEKGWEKNEKFWDDAIELAADKHFNPAKYRSTPKKFK